MRLTFQQLKKCNSRNYEIGAVRVLLVSLKLSSGANQKKKKKFVSAGIILKKNRTRSLPQFIAGDACQWQRIAFSGYLYNDIFRESHKEKSHTCEEGGARLRISLWHLLMNLKNK